MQAALVDHEATLKTRIFLYFFLNSVYNVGLNGFGSSSQEICGCFLFLLKVVGARFLILCITRWSLYHCSVVGLCILSNDCTAELQASRRTGAAYNRTVCIKDLYRVMNNLALTPIYRFVMVLILVNLESTLRMVSATCREKMSLLSIVIPR